MPSHSCHAVLDCILAKTRYGFMTTPRRRKVQAWGGNVFGPRNRRIYKLWHCWHKYCHRMFGPQRCVGSIFRVTRNDIKCRFTLVTLLFLRATIKIKRPGLSAKGVLHLHDNNRPHRANTTRLLLQPFRWEILEHPANSAVLAPSDYHLFSAKRPFWPPQISKWWPSEERYVAVSEIAGHGLSPTGILKASSVIWQIFNFGEHYV